jgi:hypothetical protein
MAWSGRAWPVPGLAPSSACTLGRSIFRTLHALIYQSSPDGSRRVRITVEPQSSVFSGAAPTKNFGASTCAGAWVFIRLVRYTGCVPAPSWPQLHEEDQWLTDAMEQQLRESTQTPDELRTQARELRAEAEQTDIKGIRDAALALAAHYEQAAADRLAA